MKRLLILALLGLATACSLDRQLTAPAPPKDSVGSIQIIVTCTAHDSAGSMVDGCVGAIPWHP